MNLSQRLAGGIRVIVRSDLPKPCLEIPGRKKWKEGYPTIMIGGKSCVIARMLLEQRDGLLGSRVTRHICDNSKCVEIDHLIGGTILENNQDKIVRGRFRFGGNYVYPKGTIAHVLLLRSQGQSYSEICRLTGLSKTYVADIATGRRPRTEHQKFLVAVAA